MEYKLHQGSLINGQTVTRDVLGRVISQDLARAGHNTRTHSYGYNTRGELTADTVSTGDSQAYTWTYDPIGNRKQAWTSRDYVSKTYHTNNLNQYTEITDNTRPSFTPAHDQEGNQTLVRTNTGDWQVTYNADNRPVTFTKGNLRIENKYDYRGRRVEKATYSNNQLQKRLRFLYNGYLQIAAVDATNTVTPVLLHTLYWDPTEPVATRPLVMILPEDNGQNWYEYTHTLNKNVSHLIDKTGSIVAHYDYDAYGNTIEQTGTLAGRNPIRFSSEYHDEELGLVYYNYRHYNPKDGRWIGRDPIEESGGLNLYAFLMNQAVNATDFLGNIEHWHHMVPTQVYNNHRDKFPAGFDPDLKEKGWILDDTDHNRKGGIHPDGWNDDYDNWAKGKKNIKPEDIAKKNKEMMEKYPEAFSRGRPADHSYNETKSIRRMLKKIAKDIGEKLEKNVAKN